MAYGRSKLSKMQLRKELVAILSKYRDVTLIKNTQLIDDLDYIDTFEDREYVLRFLMKEMLSEKALNANVCALFILELFDKTNIENMGIEYLANPKIADNKKFFLISVLKQKGVNIDYQDIASYISNPDDVAKDGVRRFLKDIKTDPEVQIDLLDFYSNIPDFEKIPLLRSVLDETEGDITALVLSLIVQTVISEKELLPEEYKILYEKLLASDSPYAVSGLEYILNNFKLKQKDDLLVRSVVEKLKAKTPGFVNDEIIKGTKHYKSFISFIDGQSNFSLIFARLDKEHNYRTFLTTVNLERGIVSCMGFSKINDENFSAILSRLFADSMPVEINPVALKGLLSYFLQKNRETSTLIPYEFVVWKDLTSDIKDINYDIIEFIRSKLNTLNLDKQKVKKLSMTKMLSTWYYTKNEHPKIDNLINEVEKEHIVDFNELEKVADRHINENFMTDEEFLKNLEDRLLMLSYICHLAELKMSSLCAYSLCFKNKYTNILVSSVIDRSLYYYFLAQSQLKDNENSIFRRKNDSKYTKNELDNLISEFEKKWNPKKEF